MYVCVVAMNRKLKVEGLLRYIEAHDSREGSYRSRLLGGFSYDSGISIRTLREYLNVLLSIGKVERVRGGEWDNPKYRLVLEAEAQ